MRDPAYRRYLRRLAAAAALYVAAILAATRLLDHGAAPSALAIGIALVPGLAVVLMILAIGRLLIEMEDEFLRMIEVRKAMIATGVTLAVTSVWGLLELFTAVPKLEVFWVFPLWCAGLGLGAMINKITHGAAGCA
jgi:hypothetical protein